MNRKLKNNYFPLSSFLAIIIFFSMIPPSTSSSTTKLYPPNWPHVPFHKGEIQVQKQLGTHDHVMAFAPKFMRPFMPDQHREFFENQPFLVVAARDKQGKMWSTLLASATTTAENKKPTMTKSPDPNTLLINAQPVPGDALEGALVPGTDLGVIGIEFATKRRNRVNGRLVTASHDASNKGVLKFKVDQSFGNCPQYIKPRQWWSAAGDNTEPSSCPAPNNVNGKPRPDHLSEEQMTQVRKAETIFLASGYRDTSVQGEDPRFGNDASHRGGPAGFVIVQDSRTLLLPDFSGNNMYNTIGNLVVDPRIGITFPDYESGGMLQVTGRTKVNFDSEHAATVYPGALRLIEITIDQVVQVAPGSIPIRWTTETVGFQERSLVVNAKIQESEDVTSFHLRPPENGLQSLWKFSPGQHLPIELAVDPFRDDKLLRTYSISAGPDWGEYRISVKRQGLASNFLHDQVQVGDTIVVHKPAGDFVLRDNDRPLVLLSNGIGVTPMISMLHHWVNQVSNKESQRKVYWIHGARDRFHHPFVPEVEELQQMLTGNKKSLLTTHIVYSQPSGEDSDAYDYKGRLSASHIATVVPNIEKTDIYMCGSDAFIADMNEGLVELGVPTSQIHYETF